jgi:hypothetical protein
MAHLLKHRMTKTIDAKRNEPLRYTRAHQKMKGAKGARPAFECLQKPWVFEVLWGILFSIAFQDIASDLG